MAAERHKFSNGVEVSMDPEAGTVKVFCPPEFELRHPALDKDAIYRGVFLDLVKYEDKDTVSA